MGGTGPGGIRCPSGSCPWLFKLLAERCLDNGWPDGAEVIEYERLSRGLSGVGGIVPRDGLPLRCAGGRDGGMLCILVREPRRCVEDASHCELTREVWDGA